MARAPARRGRASVYTAARFTHPVRHRGRLVAGRMLLIGALVLAGLKLVDVQGLQANALSAQAERQRLTKVYIPAQRGSITDRNGVKLAFSVDSDALAVHPKLIHKQWDDAVKAGHTKGITFDQHTQGIAEYLVQRLGPVVNEQDLLQKLRSDKTFVYLAEQVDPAVSKEATTIFPDIEVEHRARREYPNGPVASNIIGFANWRKDLRTPSVHGLAGLESSMDDELAGNPGKQLVDTEAGNDQVVIPGTERDLQTASAGQSVQLTIDTDLQYQVQQLLGQYVAKTGAKDGSAVVLDVRTGQVYALANNISFDPSNPGPLDSKALGDPAVTTPYEPGSVNKIVVASAVIQAGLARPDTPIHVPSEFKIADRVIHDDWEHPDQTYTVTGILARSSNIGADVLAQMVGPKPFYAMLQQMGLGQKTGVGLPGESPGYVPPIRHWSGSTFGNLPIGQGLSMTVLQMAGMYQAIANGGLRIPPRIIESVTKPDGTVVRTPQPVGVQVVSPDAAKTVMSLISHVTQDAKLPQRGTAPSAALPGYQIAGKTGTAQQVVDGRYSDTRTTTTFAGILSADHPRFVIGIMLDAPQAGEGGETAAPLFRDIAAYIAQRYNVPLSPAPLPDVPFVLQ